MSEPIVFIAAERRECAPWVSRWTAVERLNLPVHWARRGEWRGREMIALANGAGAERAYAAAKLIAGASQLWNIGFAGAADPALEPGAVVIATCIRSRGRSFRCEPPVTRCSFRSGIVLTVDKIAQTAREKGDCRACGASVMEMEAAGVARAASEAGVPFHCVRAVSDVADEDLMNDYNGALGADGRFSAFRLFRGALANPISRFGELIRLERRTALAACNLGDFLVNCEF